MASFESLKFMNITLENKESCLKFVIDVAETYRKQYPAKPPHFEVRQKANNKQKAGTPQQRTSWGWSDTRTDYYMNKRIAMKQAVANAADFLQGTYLQGNGKNCCISNAFHITNAVVASRTSHYFSSDCMRSFMAGYFFCK